MKRLLVIALLSATLLNTMPMLSMEKNVEEEKTEILSLQNICIEQIKEQAEYDPEFLARFLKQVNTHNHELMQAIRNWFYENDAESTEEECIATWMKNQQETLWRLAFDDEVPMKIRHLIIEAFSQNYIEQHKEMLIEAATKGCIKMSGIVHKIPNELCCTLAGKLQHGTLVHKLAKTKKLQSNIAIKTLLDYVCTELHKNPGQLLHNFDQTIDKYFAKEVLQHGNKRKIMKYILDATLFSNTIQCRIDDYTKLTNTLENNPQYKVNFNQQMCDIKYDENNTKLYVISDYGSIDCNKLITQSLSHPVEFTIPICAAQNNDHNLIAVAYGGGYGIPHNTTDIKISYKISIFSPITKLEIVELICDEEMMEANDYITEIDFSKNDQHIIAHTKHGNKIAIQLPKEDLKINCFNFKQLFLLYMSKYVSTYVDSMLSKTSMMINMLSDEPFPLSTEQAKNICTDIANLSHLVYAFTHHVHLLPKNCISRTKAYVLCGCYNICDFLCYLKTKLSEEDITMVSQLSLILWYNLHPTLQEILKNNLQQIQGDINPHDLTRALLPHIQTWLDELLDTVNQNNNENEKEVDNN